MLQKETKVFNFAAEKRISTKIIVTDPDKEVMLNVSRELTPLDPALVSVGHVKNLKSLLSRR